ncbi:hypothetical protein [Thermoactinomyces sp. CICC 10523]|uniref:hypothetical protein n=1 Tax=Thermoactinomyces sp. CICC 10523 TaxID=2767428 RepID=UPI0018DCC805|nr:hypothetical protein [Thermoactinomyces sp. CICC 10523]MBH8598174.1 hypothetical protein [Thermoactinomyces sp. CICC 10523]
MKIPTIGFGKITVGDTEFGAWLQKFPSKGEGKGTGKPTKFKFDFAKARKEGIKRIEDEFGGVNENVANSKAILNPRDIRFMQSTVVIKPVIIQY